MSRIVTRRYPIPLSSRDPRSRDYVFFFSTYTWRTISPRQAWIAGMILCYVGILSTLWNENWERERERIHNLRGERNLFIRIFVHTYAHIFVRIFCRISFKFFKKRIRTLYTGSEKIRIGRFDYSSRQSLHICSGRFRIGRLLWSSSFVIRELFKSFQERIETCVYKIPVENLESVISTTLVSFSFKTKKIIQIFENALERTFIKFLWKVSNQTFWLV